MSSILWALARGPAALGRSEERLTVTGGARGVGAAIAVAWCEMVCVRSIEVVDTGALLPEATAISELAHAKLPATGKVTARTGLIRSATSAAVEVWLEGHRDMFGADVLFNCVSMSSPTALEDLARRSSATISKMILCETGTVVNVVVAEEGAAHAAAEGALQKLTDALRAQAGSSPVRVVQALVRVAPGHAHAHAHGPPSSGSATPAVKAALTAAAEHTVALWWDTARAIVNRVVCGRTNISINSDAPPEEEGGDAAAEGDAAAAGGAGAPA